MRESTIHHKFIVGDPVKMVDDTADKAYLIQSVNFRSEMLQIGKQIIFSEVVFYTVTDKDFNHFNTLLLENQLRKANNND